MIRYYNMETKDVFICIQEGVGYLKIEFFRYQDADSSFVPGKIKIEIMLVTVTGQEYSLKIRYTVTVIQPKIRKEYNITVSTGKGFNFFKLFRAAGRDIKRVTVLDGEGEVCQDRGQGDSRGGHRPAQYLIRREADWPLCCPT